MYFGQLETNLVGLFKRIELFRKNWVNHPLFLHLLPLFIIVDWFLFLCYELTFHLYAVLLTHQTFLLLYLTFHKFWCFLSWVSVVFGPVLAALGHPYAVFITKIDRKLFYLCFLYPVRFYFLFRSLYFLLLIYFVVPDLHRHTCLVVSEGFTFLLKFPHISFDTFDSFFHKIRLKCISSVFEVTSHPISFPCLFFLQFLL